MSVKIDLVTATAEIDKWLDFKKIKQYKRNSQKFAIDILIDQVQSGDLIVNKDNTLTYALAFETNGLKKITVQPRINMVDFNNRINQISIEKRTESSIVSAILSCITGELAAIFDNVDPVDYEVLKAISIFFQ